MKKLLNPKLFSQQFGIPSKELDKAGLLDPFLNADTKLFIDPLLLRLSGNKIISKKAIASFRKRMSDIVSLLLASPSKTGPAWTAALGLLDLHERSETGLGYGGKGTSGSSRPDSLKAKILVTTRQIVKLGVNNPEIIGLMGMSRSLPSLVVVDLLMEFVSDELRDPRPFAPHPLPLTPQA